MPINSEKLWYGRHPLRWFLWPFSILYRAIVSIRRIFLVSFFQENFPIPVIVVGNLTVGGVGKTPLVMALVKACQEKGLRVGVVSRGYKSKVRKFPYEVNARDNAIDVGDEPLLIARKCACPVVIAPKRVEAVRYLLEKYQSQIIISDDGLQHYAMGRLLEIIVIDGQRGLGNGFCLPAGPLREGSGRLKKADLLVVNTGTWPGAHTMTMEPGQMSALKGGVTVKVDELPSPVAGVAGIGNPRRFFATLIDMGISYNSYVFPDHHKFSCKDFKFKEHAVVMTEKDAIKCQSFAKDAWYFLPVEAKLDDSFWQALWSDEKLKGCF